ncbi:MAG TPA: PIG-L family deacetylase [Dehalococcoidia bacterium]|jgi:LmbE family N-acetylglucosaminyl deacetylase|nr:PIG-L family deacetylase [Dehalococcoidia bacterium]|tara:strand:- start:359 stop:1063 length:705 start_codon:yes stop_codon:yes gene_type:complete
MDESPKKVLVITPHPDDADFWCSGTIAKWLGDGATVRYVLCTDGGKGTTDPNISSADLSKLREQEQADAVEALGVQELVLLHHPDGSLEDDDELRRELVRQIRQVQPDVVLCPEPYRKNLAWHRDHRIAGQVALDAVFPCARDHLHFVELWRDEGLEPHKTPTMLFWGTENADTTIDITESMDAKIKAVAAHKSQMDGRSLKEIEDFVRERAQVSEGGSGKEYVEAFRKVTFRV